MGELENERINRLENGVNANNTTKENRRVGRVRGGGWRIRKITEKIKRRLRGVLMKKGCEEGGVSL